MPYRSPGERTQTGPSHQRQTTADEDPQSEVKTISPEIDEIDLAPHLTNTCLQHDNPDTEGSVRLLSELVGCTIYSDNPTWNSQKLTQINIDDIVDQVSVVLGETFTAALASPVHFQVQSGFRAKKNLDGITKDSSFSSCFLYSLCPMHSSSLELTFSYRMVNPENWWSASSSSMPSPPSR